MPWLARAGAITLPMQEKTRPGGREQLLEP